MKLDDLVKSNNWLSVKLTLLGLYHDQEELLDEYKSVFEKLKLLEPKDYDMSIVLTECDFDHVDEHDVKTYIDVSGRKNEKVPNSLTDSYAFEYVEWENWLGMDIAPETNENFSEFEIIAHCLYEMTFVSYDEEEIKVQLDSLTNKVEEYKTLIEEKEKKGILTLNQLKKRLEE